MMDLDFISGALAILGVAVACFVDLRLVPPTCPLADRLEALELPAIIAVSATFAPVLLPAEPIAVILFGLLGAGMLLRYLRAAIQASREQPPPW